MSTAQRDAVPSWATGERMATDPQKRYVLLLAQKKLQGEQLKWVVDRVEEFTFEKVGEVIDRLKQLPDLPQPQNHVGHGYTTPNVDALPPGRYAVENNDGELRFYQLWQSKDKRVKRLYVQHSDDISRLHPKAQDAIAEKIINAGIRECAIRYGMEIGSCSNCGRTLTNRISRELGIGPVCGGRMFGDDFKEDVKAAKAAIIARGDDPNEDLS